MLLRLAALGLEATVSLGYHDAVDTATVIVTALTALLLPWMAWVSKVLLHIQIQLARGEENFDRVRDQLADHEARLRVIENR